MSDDIEAILVDEDYLNGADSSEAERPRPRGPAPSDSAVVRESRRASIDAYDSREGPFGRTNRDEEVPDSDQDTEGPAMLQEDQEIQDQSDGEEQQAPLQFQSRPLPMDSRAQFQSAVRSPPRSMSSLGNVTVDDEDVMEMNAREQELLVNIQELQRQLSMVQIQTDKPQEEIVPPMMDARHRLIMVSNRLPISFQRNEATGEWSFTMSSGGLVTALNGIRDQVPFIWIGWLGEEIPHEEQSKVREKLAREFNCVPVFLSKEIAAR
ncbi:Trehalose-6-P synthase/phosphatase complex synthase subunit, partial [Phytophthora boehmeriae]